MIAQNNKTIRCAVYTRKSTEENLDMDFNSLDAQRQAGEHYINSQRHEGWECLDKKYDDGGFTGGNTDRPAFQELMADVEAGEVDCIVVYKIDRLSRSLMDFARIMGILEKRDVSLVSVTQQFNTTTSMGRLTLNILFSFAQFEREIISERTRDKIAASRKMGKWTGGRPVLGYDIAPKGRSLIVNHQDARQVREIFELYLEKQSLILVANELADRGWTTKRWVTQKDKTVGGVRINKTNLYKLLTNVLYLGKVPYKENVYDGEHTAIIPQRLFDEVQEILRNNGKSGGPHIRNKYSALLRGLLRCSSCGRAMVHSYTNKGTKVYRYYVCTRAQKEGRANCMGKSLPAAAVENFVVERIKIIGRDPKLIEESFQQINEEVQRRTAWLKQQKLATRNKINAIDQELCVETTADDIEMNPRVANLNDEIRKVKDYLRDINKQIKENQSHQIDKAEFTGALKEFDPVWQMLSTAEKVRFLNLLIQRVDYDGQEDTLEIIFRTDGLQALAQEYGEQKDEEYVEANQC